MPTGLRLYARVTAISGPFNAGHTIELKFEIEDGTPFEGEMYLRVPAHVAKRYAVGDVYAIRMTPT